MSVSGIDFLWWKLHALIDSADISTITIENMPGGTLWGQAQPQGLVTIFIFFSEYSKNHKGGI